MAWPAQPSTTASVIAAALGIHDLTTLTPEQKATIQQCHLLLVMYNAFQPGIFALSGWDLVGALPLPMAAVATLVADGDTRWINRGAYDLMDVNPAATTSQAGLPRATALYGSLAEQLIQPNSFANQLKNLLAIRQQYRIYESRQLAIPDVQSKGLLVMVHELPDEMGIQITALNFGGELVAELVALNDFIKKAKLVKNMLAIEENLNLTADGALLIQLEGYTGKSYLFC
jgi:trehalose synthase